jgi:hypothetical protein
MNHCTSTTWNLPPSLVSADRLLSDPTRFPICAQPEAMHWKERMNLILSSILPAPLGTPYPHLTSGWCGKWLVDVKVPTLERLTRRGGKQRLTAVRIKPMHDLIETTDFMLNPTDAVCCAVRGCMGRTQCCIRCACLQLRMIETWVDWSGRSGTVHEWISAGHGCQLRIWWQLGQRGEIVRNH